MFNHFFRRVVVASVSTQAGALELAHSQNIFETNIKEIICMPRGH
jgi:hypothetical protein